LRSEPFEYNIHSKFDSSGRMFAAAILGLAAEVAKKESFLWIDAAVDSWVAP
jgi:hypothetical protein